MRSIHNSFRAGGGVAKSAFRPRLSSSLPVLGLLLGLNAAGGANAQTAPQAGERSMTDIIVTATRVATNVQDTPIAITAVTSETLETRGLQTTADLGSIVPNATFRKAGSAFGPAVTVYLRGIGQGDPQFNGEPAVAYYIDDVYYPFLFGSQFDLIDLERVEVLRGPQGTLFGRNAIAGAVSMVSKTPSLTEANAFIDVTVGSYQRRDIRAGFTVPLTDTLAIGASFVSKKRNGYQEVLDFTCQMFKNGTPNLAGKFPFQSPETSFSGGREPESCVINHLGGEDTRAIRGSLYWEPAPNISLSISADYMDQRDDNAAEYVYEYNYAQTYGLQANGIVNEATANRNLITSFDQYSIPGTPFRWDQRFETGDPFKTYDNACDPFPAGTLIPGNTYYNGSLFRGGRCYGQDNDLQNRGVQGKLTIGLTDQINLLAIAGYRELDLEFNAATDGTPLQDSLIYHAFHESHWNGELRMTGQHDLLDWVIGGFYYDGKAEHLGQPQGVPAGTQRYQVDWYIPKAYAAYANAVVHLSDRLNVTGGLRWSHDKKGVDFNSISDVTPAGQPVFVSGQPITAFRVDISNKRWDWKAGIDYRFTDSIMAYASAGSGYRLPGFNVRPSQPGQEGQTPGESLISYEIGAKADLFDRRLRLNASAFLMKFTERGAGYAGQEPQFIFDPTTGAVTGNVAGSRTVIPGGPAGTDFANSFTTCRAYSSATDGPVNTAAGVGVTCVSRTFSYPVGGEIKGFEAELEAEPVDNLLITGSIGFNKSTDQNVTRRINQPDWTASAGIQYKVIADEMNGTFTPRLDWYYTGTVAYHADQREHDEAAYSVINGRVTYANTVHNFEIALGATNLLNNFYYRNRFLRIPLGNTGNLGQPASPREWYLSLKKRF